MLFQKGGCSMCTCAYEYDCTFVRQRTHFRFKCSSHIGYYSAGYFDQGDYTPFSAIRLICLLILSSIPFVQKYPVFSSQGVTDHASEVRAVAIDVLLRCVKISAVLLRPHVSVLLACLLEGLTTLEPAMLSYMQV